MMMREATTGGRGGGRRWVAVTVMVVMVVAAGLLLTMTPAYVSGSSPERSGRITPADLLEMGTDSRLGAEYAALGEKGKERAAEILERSHVAMADQDSLHFDGDGSLYYADAFPPPPDHSNDDGTRRRRDTERRERTRRFLSENPPSGYTSEGIPLLHSRPGASATIYLDFNGHVNGDNAWGAFDAKGYDTNGDESSFSTSEQEDVASVFAVVAEDYAPFDIDVTTELPSDFQNIRTVHAVITYSKQRNGNNMPAHRSGGVAYFEVFDYEELAYYSPALIYVDNVSDNVDYIPLVVSHEAGHNFGLDHDGDSSQEYSDGFSGTTAKTSWGPIMGAPYDRNIVVWSKGDYPGASNTEDDLAILSSQIAYVADEAGDNPSEASSVTFPDGAGTNAFVAEGIITTRTDIDCWSAIVAEGNIDVSADPFYGSGNGANLDISLTVYDSSMSSVAVSNEDGDPSASVTNLAVTAGTYYFCVTGVGDASSGRNDYASIGQYKITGTASSGGTGGGSCTDDSYEDNDSANSASDISSVTSELSLAVCSGDDDWFSFGVCAGGTVSVVVRFSHNVGDVDIRLYDPTGSSVALSQTTTDNEDLTYTDTGSGGTYRLSVYGYEGAEAPYTLSYSVDCGSSTTASETTSAQGTTAEPTTTSNPCEGVVYKRNSRTCKRYCADQNKDFNFYRRASDFTFPGCSSKHCECISRESTTASPTTTTADPCEGTVYKRNARICARSCPNFSAFYRDAELAGFVGCHARHCECHDTDPCEGVNSTRNRRRCARSCNGGDFQYYNQAYKAGDQFRGCFESHCVCL